MIKRDIWINRGYSILPVVAGEKIPLTSWQGFQSVKTPPETIEKWWREHPTANVGLVCGRINRLVVLDCDSIEANDMVRSLGLPETVCVKTPHGYHHYFEIDASSTVKTVPQGGLPVANCELRGEGSYVLAPPSVVNGVEYVWERRLDSFPLALFSSIPEGILAPKFSPGVPGAPPISVATPVRALFSGVAEGARNSSVTRIAGGLIRFGLTFEDLVSVLLTVNSRFTPPLPESEVLRTCQSIWGLHQRCISSGSPLRSRGETSDEMNPSLEEGIHFISSLTPLSGEMKRIQDGKNPNWQSLAIDELPEPEPTLWLMDGYLAKGLKTELAGIWKAGKTTLVAEILRCMGTGEEVFGVPVKKAKVLVITEETSTVWQARRLRHDLTSNVRLICQPFKLRPSLTEWWQLVEHVVANDGEAELIVIDTLANLWPVEDENHSAGVVEALRPMDYWAREGKAVLLLHHFRKSGGTEGRASRGTGGLPAFVDILLEFKRYGKETDTKRLITAFSRCPETPKNLIIDYVEGKYVRVAEPGQEIEFDRKKRIIRLLERFPDGLTREEIVERLGGEKNYDGTTIWRDLKALLNEKKTSCEGNGGKNDPYNYKAT